MGGGVHCILIEHDEGWNLSEDMKGHTSAGAAGHTKRGNLDDFDRGFGLGNCFLKSSVGSFYGEREGGNVRRKRYMYIVYWMCSVITGLHVVSINSGWEYFVLQEILFNEGFV